MHTVNNADTLLVTFSAEKGIYRIHHIHTVYNADIVLVPIHKLGEQEGYIQNILHTDSV